MNRTYPLWLAIWIIVSGAALFLSINSFAARIPILEQVCTHGYCNETGQLPAELAQALENSGFSLSFYAGLRTVLDLVTVLVFSATGSFILIKKPKNFIAVYTSLVLFFLGTSFTIYSLTVGREGWMLAVQVHQVIAWILFIPFFYLFPDGKWSPKWTAALAGLWILIEIPYTFFPSSIASSRSWPEWLSSLYFFGIWLSCIYAQIYRYRKTASMIQKLQIKWFIFALTALVFSFFVSGLPYLTSLSMDGRIRSVILFLTMVLQTAALCMIPISIAYAILKYRMWQIDWILSRTLIYGMLTFVVISFHVLFVGGLGFLLQSPGNIVISLLSTGLIAMMFQPLTAFFQRLVNRLIYGERDEPLSILSRLAERLEQTLALDQVLPEMMAIMIRALKLSYVEITLKNGKIYRVGQETGKKARFPLLHQGDEVGYLEAGSRAETESFSKKDIKLLGNLSKQFAIAAHSVMLNTELQRSREKLVSAREEERRRLRRDLHDGIGPSLAAQTIKVGVSRQLLHDKPSAADELLASLEDDLAQTLTDIRRIIYNLRPPSLDDLGLVGAVKEFVSEVKRPYAKQGIDGDLAIAVHVHTPLPSLSAAVEVAAFRIVQESVTNVLRHARASACTIELHGVKQGLKIVVTDNGLGIPNGAKKGVGLLSMRERAGEIGGTIFVQSGENAGTRVEVFLPFTEVSDGTD